MNKKRIAILCVAMIGLICLSASPVSAQNVDTPNFTVKAVIPKNQIDKKQSYFDLKMKPGQKQTLTVNVINKENKDMVVDVALRAASTNRNGSIEYQVEVAPDDSLRVAFDSIAKADPIIKVPAKSTKKVNVTVKMPDEKYDGVILGGIVFTKRESNKPSNGVSINNQFSYVVGVKLTETEKDIKQSFHLKSVKPTLINYRNAVVANVQNSAPKIVKNATVLANIYKGNSEKPLYSVKKENVDMAPNSVYPLPIEWDGNKMAQGDYKLDLKIESNNEAFEWDENFAIAGDEAQNINNATLNKPEPPQWYTTWWGIAIIAAGALVLLWIAFILGRRGTQRVD